MSRTAIVHWRTRLNERLIIHGPCELRWERDRRDKSVYRLVVYAEDGTAYDVADMPRDAVDYTDGKT